MRNVKPIQFVHGFAAGLHTITSPDVRGLYATGQTQAEAEKVAEAMLAQINKIRSGAPAGKAGLGSQRTRKVAAASF